MTDISNTALAPIALSVYSRVEHFRRAIEALQSNTRAAESELYILSDAPKDGDEDKVKAVRAYARTIRGFKRVEILERQTNSRTDNNRQGLRMLLDRYGKVIYLEEDILTAPGFLAFINKGLEIFRERPDVFGICGYTPPVNLSCFDKPAYLSRRFVAWGFGTWKDRFDSIAPEVTLRDYKWIRATRKRLSEFRAVGKDLEVLLQRQARREIDALDVMINYTMYRDGMYVVAPSESLTHNTGFDGSGTHCGVANVFDVSLSEEEIEPEIDTDMRYEPAIDKTVARFRDRNFNRGRRPIIRKVINRLKSMSGFSESV